MLAGLSEYTLYVELAHHYMFDTTEDSCFCNPGVCYGLWQIYGYGRECAGIMAENVEYNGTELISEIFIANGFVCCGKAGQDD